MTALDWILVATAAFLWGVALAMQFVVTRPSDAPLIEAKRKAWGPK